MREMTHPGCPIERTAKLIGDRWTPLIVRDLEHGCRRFVELQRSLGGISPKTLSDRLRRLEDAGVITRWENYNATTYRRTFTAVLHRA